MASVTLQIRGVPIIGSAIGNTLYWLNFSYQLSDQYVYQIASRSNIIDHLHASENILITFLIAVTSRLDAVVARKNVLQPMGIRQSTVIKQLSRMKHTV